MNSRKPVVKRVIAVLLTITLVMCLLPANNIVQAKSQKVKLSKKNITVMIGKKKTVKLKKAKKKVKWKIVAGKKNIFLELAGSAEKIKGVRHVLYEMLFNIADNAVRYTEQNGHVRIMVGNRKGHPFYCVALQTDRRNRSGAFHCEAWSNASSCTDQRGK